MGETWGRPKAALTASMIAAALAAGCTRIEEPEGWAQVGHLTGAQVEGSGAYFPEYYASYSYHPGTADPAGAAARAAAYLIRGVNLSRRTCFDYMAAMASRNNDVQAAQETFTITAVLATGILGLAEATSEYFTGLALGSSFALSASEIYQNYYLLGPDADMVAKLIRKALDEAEGRIRDNPPKTFDQAFALLSAYADLCTSNEIRRLVREAIGNANVVARVREQTETALTDQLRIEIGQILGKPAVSYSQLVGLYWIYIKVPEGSAQEQAARMRITDLSIPAVREAQVQDALLRIPPHTRADLERQIADEINLVTPTPVPEALSGLSPVPPPPSLPLESLSGLGFGLDVHVQ